jgi:hypothetical protein
MQNHLHFYSKRMRNLHPYCQELCLLNEESANPIFLDVKEMRIGNLLSLDGAIIQLTTLCLSPVTQIGFRVMGLKLEKMMFPISTLKGLAPLCLNKEILSYCQTASPVRYEVKSTNQYGTYTTYLPQIRFYYQEVFIQEIYYLHQFQNLHYYLSGQELTVVIQNKAIG